MLITPLDLQLEPLVIHEEIAAGAIAYAEDTRQVGALPVDGQADLLVEHRGPQETVEDIRVRAGEFIIIPHGTEHQPYAEEEVHMVLLEPASTVNTGTAGGDRTVIHPEWL